MTDDYLARSGAKALLAQAVASLLEVRPANAVAFLAHHFDGGAGPVERSVRLLRACPPHRAAFHDAVFRAFQSLRADASRDSSVMDYLGATNASIVARTDYGEVLLRLSADFPVHVKYRVLDALRTTPSGRVASDDVGMPEFQRGVQVCVLLDELFAVVEELFVSIDKGSVGKVQLSVVLSALENATQQSKQRTQDELALALLQTHLRAKHDGDTPSAVEDANRSVRLAELQENVFHAVFSP